MSLFRVGDNVGKDNTGPAVNASIEALRKTMKVGTDQYEYALIDGIASYLEKLDVIIDWGKEDSSPGAKRNHEIITEALRVIHDAGSKMRVAQSEGLVKALGVLKDFNANKTTYVDDMRRLGRSFADIEITEATLALWKDVADWLQELHDHTAEVLDKKGCKKDEDGFIKPCDDQTFPHTCQPDLIFKKSTGGVSKYMLIYNYGVAAKLLKNVITTYELAHGAKLENAGASIAPGL